MKPPPPIGLASLLVLLLAAASCGPTRPARRGTLDLPFPKLVAGIRKSSFDAYRGKSVTWTGEINLVTHDYVTVKLLPDTRTHDATIWLGHHQWYGLRKAKVGQFVRFKAQLLGFSDSLLGPEAELIMDSVIWLRDSLPPSTAPRPRRVERPRPRPIVTTNLDEATRDLAVLLKRLRGATLRFARVKGHVVSWRGTLRRKTRRELSLSPGEPSGWVIRLAVPKQQRRAARRLTRGRSVRFRGTIERVDWKKRTIQLELVSIER
ncbi:MAG: hypothetical protein KC609_07095 [Myxococcales bacterium]|nr:hypothetical protein [Myxococcales bacterium]